MSGDIVVRKTRVGAFYGSDLNNRLRERMPAGATVDLGGLQPGMASGQ